MSLVLLLVGLHLAVLALVAANAVAMAHSRRRRVPAEPVPAQAGSLRVSVLVPARNEEDNLQRLLPTLLAQDLGDAEFIVVDDASEDGTARVLAEFAARDSRLTVVAGSGPPAGWVGKVHALYQATRRATGDLYVFLDADADLADAGALQRLAERWAAGVSASQPGGGGTAVTGLPRYRDRGPAALLTSLVPFAVLAALPTWLVPRTRRASLSALNGQIWMLGAADYHRLEPHDANRAEVLEDVMIGRYLKRQGVQLWFVDLAGEVAVTMYGSWAEAWAGFRKNAYLLAGGSPLAFALFFAAYGLWWVVPSVMPVLVGAAGWWPVGTLVLVKLAVDRLGRFPLWVSALAPLTLAAGAALQLASAVAHWRGTVAWKGRSV